MNRKDKYLYIGLHTLFFALLLPAIQSTQLIVLGVFKPILLIMPVTMGTITGFLVGYHRQKTREYIWSLQETQTSLEEQVEEQTRELQAKNTELERLTRTDMLTKLGNRLSLKETLEAEAEYVGGKYTYFSTMMIDVDYFKKYNDLYGHLKGDDVLHTLGEMLGGSLRGTDAHAARYGGEEFCLLLPDCDAETAERIAGEIQETIATLAIPNEGSEVSNILTISIGIYTTTTASELEDGTVIKKADKALYQAKDQGRNRYCSI